MKIRVVEGDPLALPSEALIVSLFEDEQRPAGALKAADAALGGALSTLIEQGEIKGKLGEAHVLHTLGRIAPQRVIVCGLGKQPDFTLDRARIVAANAARALRKLNVERASTVLHGTDAGVDAPLAARALAEGTLLGLYRFDKYRKEPEARKELQELSIVGAEAESPAHLEQAVRVGEVCADAASFCRDLVNEPANNMTPSALAERARDFAQELGLEIQVLERDDMERLAMGGLLAVSKGSSQPAKLIVLSYHGDADSEARLGFVGKGITFDSGGLSIKPSEHLDEMKGDMAGAAAVLCAVQAIARLKPKVNVTGLMPATENMPDGGAYRPGDILKALSGKTIEITSTDAEGRLILADALAYARQLGLAPLVDVATLTGACAVALGNVCSGGFTNDQQLMDRVVAAGADAGERIWQLPMFEEYKEQNKSDNADIKNTGGRNAGAITAAQFLAEFSGDTPWVHLDIAGTSFSEKEHGYTPKGATGVMVRTLVNLALSLAR